jgi:uncharacterized SAM-binding protein YcdF (DUF218 family)
MFILKYVGIVLGVILLGVLLTNYLSPRDELEKVDAIVAISGGNTTDRAEQAIKLYEEGWGEQIVFSGAALDPLSPSNAEVMREFAERTGIPQEVIQIEEEARTTAENAVKSEEIVEEQNFESIILVTSPYHQRRAYMEFRESLGPDVVIINYPVESDNWTTTWWFKPTGWYITISETVKVGFTFFKNLF